MIGLTRDDVELLLEGGWTPDRIDQAQEYMVKRGLFCLRPGSLLIANLPGTSTHYVFHQTSTRFEAAGAWDKLPAGSKVDAWTDGSGMSTDIAVGAAAVLVSDGSTCSPSMWISHNAKKGVDHTISMDGSVVVTASIKATEGKVSNNVAELTGIELALANCPRTDIYLSVYSDSQYALGSVDVSRGWKPKHNIQLIHAIQKHLALRNAALFHVRGHSGILFNEMADHWAGKARIPKEGV